MNNIKKRYRVPLVWQMCGSVYVEAESEEVAIKYALSSECPLPQGYYLDGSVMVDDSGEGVSEVTGNE